MKTNLKHIEIPAKNHGTTRKNKLERITPHCIVGQWTAEFGGRYFRDTTRQASPNYLIGKDGDLCLCVDEDLRSYCSSSSDNDNKAITVEIASDTFAPYKMTDAAINEFIDLCIDICQRYNKAKIVYIANKNDALKYKVKDDELLITFHRWFAAKACPGDFLVNKMPEIVNSVNSKLTKKEQTETPVYHIVKKGETLSYIARLYGTDYITIAKNNNIKNPNLITIGQKIKIF